MAKQQTYNLQALDRSVMKVRVLLRLPMNIKFEDVVRLMPTEMLAAVTANNSIVDMYKYVIGSNELVFREQFKRWIGKPYPEVTKEEFEDFRKRSGL